MKTKCKQSTWKDLLKVVKLEDESINSGNYKRCVAIFYQLNGEIPTATQFSIRKVNMSAAYQRFQGEFNLKTGHLIENEWYNFKQGMYVMDESIMLIEKDLFIFIDREMQVNLVVFDRPQSSKAKLRRIVKILTEIKGDEDKCCANLVVHNGCDITLKEFRIEPPDAGKILLNYNKDFEEIDSIIKAELDVTDGTGLVLLHGKPGTGKTSYLRHIISVTKKKVIYFPLDLAYIIGSPHGVRFLSREPNSILVIEDAEDLIKQRIEGDDGIVSNLLNLTDGILGDCLKIQVICTFNADLATIDKALLRNGRLIARYEFTELEEDRCEALFKELGIEAPVTKKMTLAEIYNQGKKDFQQGLHKKIGFQVNY